MPRYQKEPTTINFYYKDASVLLGNTPLVKFIRNYIQERRGVFSISSPVRISMTSFRAITRLTTLPNVSQTPVERWRRAIYREVNSPKRT